MEAVIRLRPEELDDNLLSKVKQLIAGRSDMEVIISVKEKLPNYLDSLNASLKQMENEDVMTFTMEEFLTYPGK